CIAMKFGIAIAARMPMITTTIISSISVNPRWDLLAISELTSSSEPEATWSLPGRLAIHVPGFGAAALVRAARSRLRYREFRDPGGNARPFPSARWLAFRRAPRSAHKRNEGGIAPTLVELRSDYWPLESTRARSAALPRPA